MRDADGKVIGTGGCGRHVCSKSDFERRGFGCQTRAMDAMPRNVIPVCPKTQAHRDRTCEKITWDSKLTERTTKMAPRTAMRRYGARDAALMDDDNNTQLRAVLAEMGILDDDVQKIIARLSDTSGIDSAPSNLGASDPNEAVMGSMGGDPESDGGGSTRSYAPTDPDSRMTSASDRAMRRPGGAADHVSTVMAKRQVLYASGRISASDVYMPISPPLVAMDERRKAQFPHYDRLG